MTREQREAHMRMLESDLPRRVVGHNPSRHEQPLQGRYSDAVKRYERVQELKAQGLLQKDVAQILNCSPATVSKHWRGLVKAVHK
jgi:DNA-binding NarL/FixJ family response regulator